MLGKKLKLMMVSATMNMVVVALLAAALGVFYHLIKTNQTSGVENKLVIKGAIGETDLKMDTDLHTKNGKHWVAVQNILPIFLVSMLAAAAYVSMLDMVDMRWSSFARMGVTHTVSVVLIGMAITLLVLVVELDKEKTHNNNKHWKTFRGLVYTACGLTLTSAAFTSYHHRH